MSRPRQFVEEDAVEGAMKIFWIQGYAGTNLPELLDAMSLSRGSFYKAFGDKHSVYLRAIDHYDTTLMSKSIAQLMDPANGSPKDRLKTLFSKTTSHPDDSFFKMGCFVCNVMVERAPFDQDCAEKCDRITASLRVGLASVVREAMPEASDAEIERRAAAFQKLYTGAHAMGRMGASYGDWSELIEDLL